MDIITKGKTAIKEVKGSTGIESFVKIDKNNAAVNSVKALYENIGALAVSLDNSKTAQKKLQARLNASEDGKKLQAVKAKAKADKKKLNEALSMYRGQLLLCKNTKTELPKELIDQKLLNS